MSYDPERLLRKNWNSVNEFARELYVMVKGGMEPAPARAVTPASVTMIPNPVNVVQQVFNRHQQIANEQMMARIDEVFAVQQAKQSGYVSPPETHRVPESAPLLERQVEPAVPLISQGTRPSFQVESATAVAYEGAPAKDLFTPVNPARPYDFPDFVSRPPASQHRPARPMLAQPQGQVPEEPLSTMDLRQGSAAAEVRDYASDLTFSQPAPLESRHADYGVPAPIEGTSFEVPANYQVANVAPAPEVSRPAPYRTQGHDQEIPPVPLTRIPPNPLDIMIGVTDDDGMTGLVASTETSTYGTAGTGMCKFLDFDNKGAVSYAKEEKVKAWNLTKFPIGGNKPVFLLLTSISWFAFPVTGQGVIHGIVTATIGPYAVGGNPGTGKVQMFTKQGGTWVTSGVPVDVINWFNVTAAVNKHCLIAESDGVYTLVSLDC